MNFDDRYGCPKVGTAGSITLSWDSPNAAIYRNGNVRLKDAGVMLSLPLDRVDDLIALLNLAATNALDTEKKLRELLGA